MVALVFVFWFRPKRLRQLKCSMEENVKTRRKWKVCKGRSQTSASFDENKCNSSLRVNDLKNQFRSPPIYT